MLLNWMKASVVASVCCLPFQSKANAVEMRFAETIPSVCEINTSSSDSKRILFKGEALSANNSHVLTFNTNNVSSSANVNFELEKIKGLMPKHSISADEFKAKEISLLASKNSIGSSDKKKVINTTIHSLSSIQTGIFTSHEVKNDMHVWIKTPNIEKSDLSTGDYEYLVTASLDCT